MELNLRPYNERPDLIARPTFEALVASGLEDIHVVEIDPAYMGGPEFCSTYGVDIADGATCVVLEASRSDRKWYVSTLVPVGYRVDMGGFVRRNVNARKITLAPLDFVLSATEMEYGSITVIGLPHDWTILVDKRISERDFVFLGSGKVRSKLRVPGRYFTQNNFSIIDGLGIS